MNKQHLKANRPATLPTPQGNMEPKLLDSAGNIKPVASTAIAPLDMTMFRLDIPSISDEASSGRSEALEEMNGQISFGRASLLQARKDADNLEGFIEYCEEAYKGLKQAAEALITPHLPAYLEWAKQYRPTQSITTSIKNRGSKVILTPEDYDDSVETILWLMAKISNTKLFGKPATKSKKATPSLFYNPKAVTKITGFEGKSEKVRAMAEVNFLIVDLEGDIEYFFTQLGDLARYVLHGNEPEANNIWRKLTGKVVADQRVVFPEKMIRDLAQARMYGSLAAQFSDEARKAKEKNFKLKLSEAEEARLTEWANERKAALNKAADDADKPKIERIPGSKVESTDTKATLPQAIQHPKTLEEVEWNREIKRIGKAAEAEMAAAINDGRLDASDLDVCQTFYQEAYNRLLAENGIIEQSDDETAETPSDEAVEDSTTNPVE